MEKETKEQNWFRRHWIVSIFLGIMVLGIIGSMFGENDSQGSSDFTGNVVSENSNNNVIKLGESQPQVTTTLVQTTNNPEDGSEMTTEQIFNEFDGLSDIQIEEKIKTFKGKQIKTSLYVSKIDKASLSSQYVAMEMYEYPYNLMPYVKAFFPAEEKDKLLKANIGDTLIFSGEFVTYKKGGLTSYIEFTKSRVIEIKSTDNVVNQQNTETTTTQTTTPAVEGQSDKATMGEKNALSKALSYLEVMAFSYSGLIKQLEYEGYSHEEAKYGADNCGANWNEQAALKAQSYLDVMPFSQDGLIKQLEYEGFTRAQAEYGVQAVGY